MGQISLKIGRSIKITIVKLVCSDKRFHEFQVILIRLKNGLLGYRLAQF